MKQHLKNAEIWPSLEVHAIYQLVWILCMSKEGVAKFQFYLSAADHEVLEPLFIAQYLLAPTNTIVKSCLADWMMTPYLANKEKANKKDLSEANRGRYIKAEQYLKHTILVELMDIIKAHGRSPDYHFNIDKKLSKIKNGPHGCNDKDDKNKILIAIKSFMDIWLLTLPEKFEAWYENHLSHLSKKAESTATNVF